jgi:hypothetical protein
VIFVPEVLQDLIDQATALEEPAMTAGSTGETHWLPNDEDEWPT